MRTLTVADIVLHPSTVEGVFEQAVADLLAKERHAAAGLWQVTGDAFPAAYRLMIFDGGLPDLADLGADVTRVRTRELVTALPERLDQLDGPQAVLLTVLLPLRMVMEGFELSLHAALSGEVGRLTRLNLVRAAVYTRSVDEGVPGRIEYLIVASGTMPSPRLRPRTLQLIADAGGMLQESVPLRLVSGAELDL